MTMEQAIQLALSYFRNLGVTNMLALFERYPLLKLGFNNEVQL